MRIISSEAGKILNHLLIKDLEEIDQSAWHSWHGACSYRNTTRNEEVQARWSRSTGKRSSPERLPNGIPHPSPRMVELSEVPPLPDPRFNRILLEREAPGGLPPTNDPPNIQP